jgi:hypothetical protein
MQMRRDKQATIEELRQARRKQREKIEKLKSVRQAQKDQIEGLRQKEAEYRKRLSKAEVELVARDAAIAEKDAAIAAMQSSTSWRLTKPIRAMTRVLKAGSESRAAAEGPGAASVLKAKPEPLAAPDSVAAPDTTPEPPLSPVALVPSAEFELVPELDAKPDSECELASELATAAPPDTPAASVVEAVPATVSEEDFADLPDGVTLDERGFPVYPRLEAVQGLSFGPYDSAYQEDIDFSDRKPPVKTVAFYLPQFHAIPENDAWWGEGFTEWTNTRKALPLYPGHYEPREPHDDIGYYDLSDVETIKRQAALAARHGIYGFCLYYYWFSGKRLLEKPLELLLAHPEIDLNFCLCWANENWTRRWDGQDNEVLIAQDYAEDDPGRFIDSIADALRDPRYIRVGGKPIILLYNPRRAEALASLIKRWRSRAHDLGIGEIQVLMCRSFGSQADRLADGLYVDGEVEFPPHGVPMYDDCVAVKVQDDISIIYSYETVVEKMVQRVREGELRSQLFDIPFYRTVTMAWDNTPRKKTNWRSTHAFSLKAFYRWTRAIVEDAQRYDQDFVFVNAWNEWGEGVYLEPDKKYGYALINTLSKALFGDGMSTGE